MSLRFTEDEASMWWYAYARRETAGRPLKPTEQKPTDDSGPGKQPKTS